MHPNRRNPPCRYGRFVRRRISSASARRASYSRSCADLRRSPLAAPELLVTGDGEGDGLLFGAAVGDGEVAGTGAAVGTWDLPPSDLLRSLRNPRAQRREPPREEEEDEVVEAEDAVEEDDDERDAAGVTAGSSADSVSGGGGGEAPVAEAAGDLRQCVRNGDKDRAFRRTERPRKRPRSSAAASRSTPSSSAVAAPAVDPGDAAGCWGWRRAAERRTGRIWPLQKSSSAEDMAAAEGEGKREEKSKSKSRTPLKSLPAPPLRVGLAGAL
nr:unnamed protein product [Digitaria exilis]